MNAGFKRIELGMDIGVEQGKDGGEAGRGGERGMKRMRCQLLDELQSIT